MSPAHETTIALSVIITVVGGELPLRRCLARLVPQVAGRPIELIVPYDRTAHWVATLQAEFPNVLFTDLGEVQTRCRPGTEGAAHEIYDCRRSFGLNQARGEILALLEDNSIPDADWCDQILQAHQLPHAVIGGCVDFGGQRLLDWAVYLQDFGRYERPLPEGAVQSLTDINVSYKRQPLFAIRETWRARYSEMTVHQALVREGATLWRRPQIVVHQNRELHSFRNTLGERYHWGRLFGSVRVRELSTWSRLAYLALSPVIPLVLIARMARKTGRRGRFVLALPYLLCLTSSWCLGEFMGYLTGSDSGERLPAPDVLLKPTAVRSQTP
jgi:hypothetical protein